MIKENVKYPKFSEFDFIRLYCAINFKNGLSPIIVHHELEKKLYEFYFFPEYRGLFKNIYPKKDLINPENGYLKLDIALNTAQIEGLLVPIHGSGEISSIISCNEDIAHEIISSFDKEIVDKMVNLFNTMQNIQEIKLVKSKSKKF